MLRASLALLALGFVLRLAYPASDPHYYRWLGFVRDEGRWVEHARRAALGGDWIESRTHNEHLLLSPVFSAASYAAFRAGGVSAVSARVFPALSGCLLLLLLAGFLYRRVPPAGLFLASATLAVQGDLVMLSRIAIPEMPLALATLGVFCVLYGPGGPRPFWSGALSALLLAVKATGFPLVLLFGSLVFAHRPGPLSIRDRERWRPVGRFALGAGSVGAAGGIGVALLAPEHLAGLGADLRHVATFLALPSARGLADALVYSNLAPVTHLGALAVWSLAVCGGYRWGIAPPALPRDPPSSLERAAWIWLALYPVQLLLMKYFPPRYRVHALVPLALVLAVSVFRWRLFRVQDVVDALHRSPSPLAWLRRSALWLPALIWCAPLLALAVVSAELPLERVRHRAPVVACLVLGAGLAGARAALDPTRVRRLIAFPWACTLLWFALFLWLPGRAPFWPDSMSAALALLGVMSAGAIVAWGATSPACARAWAHAPVAIAAAVCALWLFHLAPVLYAPTYSVRDASREIGRALSGAAVVMSSTEGLFLDNAIPHRDPTDDRVDDRHPETYVVFAGTLAWEAEMVRRYDFWTRYESVARLPLHRPEAHRRLCKPSMFSCRDEFAAEIYRRRADADPFVPSRSVD